MKKNNLTIKYSIGLLVITFIVLLVERIIFLLFNKINFNTFRCLLFLSPIVIPLVGLYILQKIKSFFVKIIIWTVADIIIPQFYMYPPFIGIHQRRNLLANNTIQL